MQRLAQFGTSAQWYRLAQKPEQLALANDGLIVLLDPAFRGDFACHVTTLALADDERRRVRFVEPRFWLEVRGAELLLGDLQDELELDAADEYRYLRSPLHIACAPGRYRVEVYDLLRPETCTLEHATAYAIRLHPLAPGNPAPQLDRLPYDDWRFSGR
jgi:hypothetical protein